MGAEDRRPDGTGWWLGWLSPLWPVWLWHALSDGTLACRCPHSAQYRGMRRKLR